MKKLLLLIIGLMVNSCLSKYDRVEKDLYNCLIISLSDEEKEKVNPIFSDFEQHLIDKGILESSSPEGYWNFYKKIADTGTYDFSNEFNFSEKISFLNRENPEDNNIFFDCHNEVFQTEKYLKSKLYKFNQESQSLRSHRVTPTMIAITTTKYLTAEDFELEYYRLSTLLFIENLK
ncbi:hypothetical protein [Pontimicrobium sp. SW4]|uniref:Lipoprotein n=1 Tax=Pontimicrobium sp. SW4 TaxID=3153519 RepID=A0AAU7BP48_9FLAO